MIKYVIDSSSFINAGKFYPKKSFESFWTRVLELNQEGKVIIIKRVKEELLKGCDYLSQEFIKTINVTNEDIPEVINLFGEIMNALPEQNREGLGNWIKGTDPYVIAYAFYLKKKGDTVILIHGESEKGKRIKIPYVCNVLKLTHDEIHRIIREEDFKFKLV
jgi:hypothetical protein